METKIATLVMIVRNEELLLGRKLSGEIGKGLHNAPGGKVEQGETLKQGACRECREEVGVIIDPTDLVFAARLDCWVEKPRKHLFQQVYVYRASAYAGEPRPTESMVPKWFHLSMLPYELMHEADRHWMPAFLAAKNPLAITIQYRKKGEGFLGIEFFCLPKDERAAM